MSSSWAYAVWAVLAGAALALWAFSHSTAGRRVVVGPLGVLTRLAADPWLRVLLLLAWAWAGWHLFAR